MIDEKKIEEAANKYAQTELYYHDFQSSIAGFKAGINWFKDNIWHDASEEPKVAEGKYWVTCLIKFKNGSVDLCSYFPSLEDKWVYDDMIYEDFLKDFDSWLYIEDLMKGDKK